MERRRWELQTRDPAAASNARRQFSAYLHKRAEPAENFDAAELIFGELLANAIKYGREPIRVRLEPGEQAAVLTIEDGGDCFGMERIVRADPLALGGRGVQIASAFARSLRVERIEGGPCRCRVTVELPVRLRAIDGS